MKFSLTNMRTLLHVLADGVEVNSTVLLSSIGELENLEAMLTGIEGKVDELLKLARMDFKSNPEAEELAKRRAELTDAVARFNRFIESGVFDLCVDGAKAWIVADKRYNVAWSVENLAWECRWPNGEVGLHYSIEKRALLKSLAEVYCAYTYDCFVNEAEA